MELGWGRVGVGSAFLLRLPRFLKVSGTRFRAVAGNRYVLPGKLLTYLWIDFEEDVPHLLLIAFVPEYFRIDHPQCGHTQTYCKKDTDYQEGSLFGEASSSKMQIRYLKRHIM